jgi:protein ImuA
MPAIKSHILAQLQKEIFSLQGFKSISTDMGVDVGLGTISQAFLHASFPLGVIHEFCYSVREDGAVTAGFTAGILSTLMQNDRAILWISSSRTLFPPALISFGIMPDKIIFIDLQKERDVLWAMEEALKCDGLAAVVAELHDLSFTASRRLQLAVERSRVTGFVLRNSHHKLNTTACVTRWKITSLPSVFTDEMPGVGFPQWNVELLKVRNGIPGNWKVAWINGSFRHMYEQPLIMKAQQKKTG